jgi:outer membrane protein TolC
VAASAEAKSGPASSPSTEIPAAPPAVAQGAHAAQPPADVLADDASLADYLEQAAVRNPGLEAAFNEWKAALERIPQMKSLPDPQLTYRAMVRQMTPYMPRERQAFGLMQMLPWYEKLVRRGGVAAAEAEAARQRYESARLALAYRVKAAYYEYYYLARSVDVVRENLQLVTYLEGVARARYRVAAAEHPDVIRAQLELGMLDDRLRMQEDMRPAVAARLNAAMNRPTGSPLPWPKDAAEERVAVADDEVVALLRETSPDLKAMEDEVAARREAVALARVEAVPDVSLGVEYMQIDGARASMMPDDSRDMVAVMASVSIPVWYEKYAAGVREAEARHMAAVKERLDRENDLAVDARMALYGLRDAARRIGLYRDTLLPKARQSLKATEAAFRAGTVNFVDLVDAERVLLEFDLAYHRALADHATRLAELEMLIGRPLPRAPAQETPPAEPPVPQPSETPAPPAPEPSAAQP